MKKCISLTSISAVTNCVAVDNRAGIVDKIIIGYADEVGTWPELPVGNIQSPISLMQAGRWNGDLAMKNGCKMVELNFTDETGEFKITDQGEKGGKSFLYELELSRAKMNATMFGLENAIKDRKLVILVRDRNEVWYLMGDKFSPVMKIDGDGSTTGKTGTDQNKTSLKFQYTCPRKLVYKGEIDSLLVSNDYSDKETYTILDMGRTVKYDEGMGVYVFYPDVTTGTPVDKEQMREMIVDCSRELYQQAVEAVENGKIPVLKAILVFDANTEKEVELPLVYDSALSQFISEYAKDGLQGFIHRYGMERYECLVNFYE